MRKNNSRVLKELNAKGARRKKDHLLNGSTKANSGSITRSNGLKGPKTVKTNSTRKQSWKDDAELEAILQVGIDFKNEGKYQEAIHAFEKAVRKSPRCSMAYWLLGGVYYTLLHDPKASIPYFKKAVKLSPKTEMASLGLFHALWDTDRIYEALEEIKRYQLLTNWKCRDYLEIMDEINAKWNDPPKAKIKKVKS
jgi:tetratricopeptide (TPR) repeat protein